MRGSLPIGRPHDAHESGGESRDDEDHGYEKREAAHARLLLHRAGGSKTYGFRHANCSDHRAEKEAREDDDEREADLSDEPVAAEILAKGDERGEMR